MESEGITDTRALNDALWLVSTDGSLRGAHPLECISSALSNDRLEEAVYQYCENAARYTEPHTWRCSTHVHMNMLDCTGKEVASTMLTSYAADNYFYAAGDDARRGNYNCRPVSLLIPMAEYLGTAARYFHKNQYVKALAMMSPARDRINLGTQPDQRYVGMNWCALPKFGTVELRHFPGSRDAEEIFRWIHMTSRLRLYRKLSTVAQVEAKIQEGPIQFGRTVFGELWDRVEYPGHEDDWHEVIEGLEHFMARFRHNADSSTSLHGVLRKKMVVM